MMSRADDDALQDRGPLQVTKSGPGPESTCDEASVHAVPQLTGCS